MSFFSSFFQKKVQNNQNNNGEDFIVDDNGLAQEISKPASAPVSESTNVIKSDFPANAQTSNSNQATSNSNQNINKDESVGDTSAFEELMAQAENVVDARVLDKPILDPEFEKAQQEIANEEGIEIFPSE